ncbi:Hcp family type VI secretion system effector [Sphingomonas sp.]|uniref:Hcp family type VI secretion system effector n=1 Tax=Sphingomonas sp. TaxID=28214 RepID=UPI003AFF7647
MATDFFLDIDDLKIKGEATARHAKDHIDVHSMSFGVTQPHAVGRTGAGLSTGKASFGEIHFTKYTDKASPKLYMAAGSGTHFGKAVFSGFKHGDKPILYFKVTLSDVMVTSFQNSGAGGSEMTEQVSFGYSKIEFEYVEQTKEGGTSGKNLAMFDVREGANS